MPGSSALWMVLSATVLLAAFVSLGLAVYKTVPPVDAAILAVAAVPRDSWLMAAVMAVNVAAGFPLWDLAVLAAALMARLRGLVRESIFVALSLSGDLVVAVTKALFGRPRPSPSTSDLIATFSYPSGHVARMVITLGIVVAVLAWRYPRLRLPTVVAAALAVALVAACRVVSGEHWPTDTVGGVFLGLFWLEVLLIAWTRAEGRRREGTSAPGSARP